MGRHSNLIGENDYAISWFAESLRKHELERQKTAPIEDILQYYAFSSFNKGKSSVPLASDCSSTYFYKMCCTGNLELATQLANRLIQILPRRRSELSVIYKSAQILRAVAVQSTLCRH